MTTKTKIIIALVVVSIIVGISLFFYYRGKKKVAADAAAAAKKLSEVPAKVIPIGVVGKQMGPQRIVVGEAVHGNNSGTAGTAGHE